MSSRIIDLTLPAHDPSFPKLRGLLPVPPEVQEFVACQEARITRQGRFILNLGLTGVRATSRGGRRNVVSRPRRSYARSDGTGK